MNILMIAVNDPAGTAIALCKALSRYTGHTARLITLETRYTHSWAGDVHLPWLGEDELEGVGELLRQADVFHFHMTADENLELGPYRPRDFLAGKLLVHHHHGHPDFRGNPEKYQAKYRELGRNKLLVSTPDLLHKLPGARWQPNLVPVSDPLYRPLPWGPGPADGGPGGRVRIAHAPTRKDLKNTGELLAAVERLSGRGLDCRAVLIDDMPHVECLRVKRGCHLVFDHLQGYYGVSSLESLSQGSCVVAGLDEWNISHVRDFTGRERLPWALSSPGRLEEDLEGLVRDPDLRAEHGTCAREFMESCWNEPILTQRLVDFYES